MRGYSRRIFFIVSILSVVFAGLLVLYLSLSARPVAYYDFVQHFYDAERKFTVDENQLLTMLTDESYFELSNSIVNYQTLLGKESKIVSESGNKNIAEDNSAPGGILYINDVTKLLSIKQSAFNLLDENSGTKYTLIFEKTKKKGTIKLIEKAEKGNLELKKAAFLPGSFDTKDLSLAVFYFDRYLIVNSKTKALFYYDKLKGPVTGFEIGKEAHGVGFSYKPIKSDDEITFFELSLSRTINKEVAGGYHINHFYPEHRVMIEDKESEFVQRILNGRNTRPAILLTLGSQISWDLKLPDKPMLRFAPMVFCGANYASDVIFEIIIEKDKVSKSYKFKTKRIEDWSKKVSLDLSKYSGAQVKLTFSAKALHPDRAGLNSKIVTAWGDPRISTPRSNHEKNVILISLDTLRADHVGCYGYHRPTTPNIDQFAKEGVTFLNTITASAWTLPSHFSMLTGIYPVEAGYKDLRMKNGLWTSHYFASRLAPECNSVAEYLRDAGYLTAGYTGAGFLSPDFNFDQGFGLYSLNPHKQIEKEIKNTIEWIEENRSEKFFLFFHTYQIHSPYEKRHFTPESDSILHKVVSNYDSGIWYTDKYLGDLFKYLKDNKLWEDTIVIVTSDHGENFSPRYMSNVCGVHGRELYDYELKVPLIIKGLKSNNTPLAIKSQVESVDILPTILDALEIEQKEQVRGRSLVPLFKGESQKERFAYTSCMFLIKDIHKQHSVRTSDFKLIRNMPEQRKKHYPDWELYDLQNDPRERKNIITSNKDIFDQYSSYLDKIIRSIARNTKRLADTNSKSRMNDELKKQLTQLGYIDAE